MYGAGAFNIPVDKNERLASNRDHLPKYGKRATKMASLIPLQRICRCKSTRKLAFNTFIRTNQSIRTK